MANNVKLLKRFNESVKISSAIRQVAKYHPQKRYCLENSVHPIATGPRGGKMYQCAKCKNAFSAKEVDIDHIESVCPLEIPIEHLSWDIYIERLFCGQENLQVLCKSCHKEKSKSENTIRRAWADAHKYIVYKTYNKINNKFYIGVHGTSDINDGYLGSGKAFKAALKKYGISSFTRYVIAVVATKEEAYALEKEIVTMDVVNDRMSYNLKEGGNSEAKLSEESRAKIAGNREYATGRDHPASKRVGCLETGETFDCISDTNMSHVRRAIIDGTQAGGYHWEYMDHPELNAKKIKPIKYQKRKVLCIETNKIYNSLVEAALDVGLSQGGDIGDVCRRNRRTAAGYTWKFIDIK